MKELVLLEKKQHTALITLNRPEAMNALCRELREQLTEALADCQRDEEIRVIVLTGAGKAFCAGFDLKEMSDQQHGNAAEASENQLADAMRAFTGPIIAAVNGHAITGGFELALACDLIIASELASFADTHARVGILPGWGLSQRLPRLIGLGRAKELSFSGRRISAEQAERWGLVNRMVSASALLSEALALAEQIAQCEPEIISEYKQLIDTGYNMPLEQALRYEAELGMRSAVGASSAMIAARTNAVLERGRQQNSTQE